MFAGRTFPPTESAAAGVSFSGMFREVGRPLFLVIWLSMWLTAATELGPGQWYANIFNEVTQSATHAGIILLVWVNGIMYVMRQFFGRIPHTMSPTLLIAVTAPLAALGLYLFGQTTTPMMWYVAAALLAVGTAFWWPTMLGITSERFPAGGALLLAIIGASGSISTAICGTGDGLDQRDAGRQGGAANVGGAAAGADGHLRDHRAARSGEGRVPGGADFRTRAGPFRVENGSGRPRPLRRSSYHGSGPGCCHRRDASSYLVSSDASAP